MSNSAQTLLNEFDAYMTKRSISCGNCYVGVTNDIDDRLHGFHRVPRDHCFIWGKAFNVHEARRVEKTCLAAGCKDDSGGGDNDSIFVYAYEITPFTVERAVYA